MTNLSFLTVSFKRQKHMNTVLYILPRKVVKSGSTRYVGKKRYLLLHQEQDIYFPLYTAPSLIFLCKPGLFSQVQSGKEVQLTAHIHEVLKLRTCGATSSLPPHTASYGAAQLSTDSHTIHTIKFLYLQNYPRLVCDALITIFHHKIHTLFPFKITWLHDLCMDSRKCYVTENILLNLWVYVEHWVRPTLADIMEQYACLSLNPFMCLLYFICIYHYKSSLHTF
jgi:hypothetical protein